MLKHEVVVVEFLYQNAVVKGNPLNLDLLLCDWNTRCRGEGVKLSNWMVLSKGVCIDPRTSDGNHLFESSYAIIRLELKSK